MKTVNYQTEESDSWYDCDCICAVVKFKLLVSAPSTHLTKSVYRYRTPSQRIWLSFTSDCQFSGRLRPSQRIFCYNLVLSSVFRSNRQYEQRAHPTGIGD